ncbi:DUF397 domain-containing protein [Actinomadura adrarensis]|uniref:DUF397 domain-containing protein n=1 Tax=Actinomadura adrarensis TaxID=1819600 RepID=A0ABW3CT08_9ACTN
MFHTHGDWRSAPDGECVEVRQSSNGWISVRDSKVGERSPVLEFTPAEWTAFMRITRSIDANR